MTRPASGRRRRWADRHPQAADALLAAAVTAASLAGVPPTPQSAVGVEASGLTPLAAVLLVAVGGILAFRRRYPLPVWAGTLLVVLGTVPALDSPGRGLPILVVALYTVAAHTNRRIAAAAGLLTGLAAFGVVAARFDVGVGDALAYAAVAWTLLPAAIGDAVRSGREVVAAAVERAERAEATREEEARRRVAEERLRIGRELHDVVAHHVATITVHAGVAEHLLTEDPVEAGRSLRHVRSSSTRALEEMHALVDVLRGAPDGDEPRRQPDTPAPTFADLEVLVERMRASGSVVTHRRAGTLPVLNELTGLHLYRIAQEALTNAARHGIGPVELDTVGAADEVRLVVRNGVSSEPARLGRIAGNDGSGGHGLVGMRERALLVGADLTAGVEPGGRHWVVDVRVPVRPAGAAG
ncbi:MAG: sensor histidine kinase [Dermatophilaceae bacterium]